MPDRTWYMDSSVVLRALMEESTDTRVWLSGVYQSEDRLLSSRLLELEVTRVLKNAGADPSASREHIDQLHLVPLTDDLVDAAMSFDERLDGADALHVATATRLGADLVTIITHDRQMAIAAANLGFDIVDPVTDDPGREPVTEDLQPADRESTRET